MNCGFVSTHKDARYLGYEATKKSYFEGLARGKTLLHHSDNFVPIEYVDSPVFQLMSAACNRNESGVCVVYCESGYGKSAAAHLVLKHSCAGVMIGVPSLRKQSYWDAVAKRLGVPPDDNGNFSYEWSALLVDSIAGTTTTQLRSKWQKFQNGVLCNPAYEPDDPPDLPVEAQAGILPARRILIFDNFDRVSEEDAEFVRCFYEKAFELQVLVFVLTQDSATANRLLRINAWKRIKPLRGICTANHNEGDRMPVEGYFSDPTWNQVTWTAVQLEALVRSRFRKYAVASLPNVALPDGRTALDMVVQHLALQDGYIPLDVIVRAQSFIGENGGY